MPKKIYISGKITGENDYKHNFDQEKLKLEAEGYIVLNPAILPEGLTNADYMQINFAMINVADAVYFMKNYITSPGAMLEYNYCKYIGKEILKVL